MASSRNAVAGSRTVASASDPGSLIGARLPSQDVQVIGHCRPPHPEDQDDQGEAESDLGDGDADGEHGEDEPRGVGVEAREGHEVDVDGVQHELDAEQDADGVAAGDDPEEADGEQRGGEREVRLEPHAYSSGLAKYRAPSSAARKSTPSSSRGGTKRVRRARPMACITSPAMGGAAGGRGTPPTTLATTPKRAPATMAPLTR